ncbi:MAG: Holliday junction branch migration protein RuvA [Anaerotruncus sp.]|nr:Holliday junction branch migration protein RuvA [Anaerotruncus sp.]
MSAHKRDAIPRPAPFIKISMERERLITTFIALLTTTILLIMVVVFILLNHRGHMIYSIEGTIIEIQPTYVAISTGALTYQVYVARPDYFSLNANIRLYTHQVVREDEIYLVGFKQIQDRDIFAKLITVKGIGPRTALGAMSETTAEQLVTAISANNITFLKKLPGIGAKAAAQIIPRLKRTTNDWNQRQSAPIRRRARSIKATRFPHRRNR